MARVEGRTIRALIATAHGARSLAAVLAITAPFVFLAVAVVRTWPFVDDVPVLAGTDWSRNDDWEVYRTLAHSIVRDGLLIEVLSGPYVAPRGFLYNYFIAGVFAVAGENASLVYVFQSALVGAVVPTLYLATRAILSGYGSLLFVFALVLELSVDVLRPLSVRLLSENLAVFILALAVAVLVRWGHSRTARAGLALGVVLGLLFLARPPMLLAIGVVLLSGLARTPLRARARALALVAVLVGFGGVSVLLPLRNLAAASTFSLDSVTNPTGVPALPASALSMAEYQARNALFTLGFTTAMGDNYRWRPQWMAIWVGFAGYVVWRVRLRKLPEWEFAAVALAVLYILPVTALGIANNYGGRLIVVAMPVLLLLATMWLDGSVRPLLLRSLLPSRRANPRGA